MLCLSNTLEDVIIGSKVQFSEYSGTYEVIDITHSNPRYFNRTCYMLKDIKDGEVIIFNDIVMGRYLKEIVKE